jgi:hypothetical protein
MPYVNEKNRLDRLKAQKKYYEKNRELILVKLKNKRIRNRKLTLEEGLLMDLYQSLKSYLQNANLIDWCKCGVSPPTPTK